MKTILAENLRIALIVLLMLIFALNGPHEAGAQTGDQDPGASALPSAAPNVVEAVPGGPGYVSLSGLNFRPYIPSLSYSFSSGGIQNTGASLAYFIAPFQIPNGATINKMVVYYFDQDAGATKDLEVELLELPLGSGVGVMATFMSSGSLSGPVYGETTTILDPLVNLSINSYAIQVGLPASINVLLTAVRIDYVFQTSLPLVTRQ